jgi:hypothetical protein
MTLIPHHPILRIAATLWLLAAVVLLLVTLLRPEIQVNERAALSSLVPLYFLSLPLGHLGVLALGWLKVDLYVSYQYVPGVFAEGLALWTLLVVLGYVQWFVLVPWLAGQFRRLAGLVSGWYLAR